MPTAMVTFNGRITLPFQVRKQLGLKTGDNVEFVEIEKGRFAIAPGAAPSAHLDEWSKGLEFTRAIEEMDESIH